MGDIRDALTYPTAYYCAHLLDYGIASIICGGISGYVTRDKGQATKKSETSEIYLRRETPLQRELRTIDHPS